MGCQLHEEILQVSRAWKWPCNHGLFTQFHAKIRVFSRTSRICFVDTLWFSLTCESNRWWWLPGKMRSWMHGLIWLCWRNFLPSSKTHRFWWGGVGWDVNVHWHFHKYVMLRHCPFFCNFHTYVMLRWGGVGWDVNVHWHFHKYVMLRHGPFFCNFHTYVMLRWGGVGWGGMLTFIGTSTSTWCYATARSSATSTHTCVKKKVGCRNSVWAHTGGIDNWWKLCKDSVPNNIPSTKGSMKVDRKIFRYVRSFQWRWENPRELLKTTAAYIKQLSWFDFGPLEEKNAERLVDEKVKPSSSETPIFASKLTFRYGETMNLC